MIEFLNKYRTPQPLPLSWPRSLDYYQVLIPADCCFGIECATSIISVIHAGILGPRRQLLVGPWLVRQFRFFWLAATATAAISHRVFVVDNVCQLVYDLREVLEYNKILVVGFSTFVMGAEFQVALCWYRSGAVWICLRTISFFCR